MEAATEVSRMDGLMAQIEGESYSLFTIPNEKTKLVQAQIGEILNGLGLKRLVEGLDKTRGLLWLAYNGVAGYGALRGDINKAQDRLTVLCRDANLTLQAFERCSANILENLTQCFSFLIKERQVEVALEFMKDCSRHARAMEQKAQELATGFDNLAQDVVDILAKTQREQGLSEARQKELDSQLRQLDIDMKEAEKLADELHKLVTDLQNKYNDASQKLERAENRAFAMGIISAIMAPLAQGIGAFAGVYASSGGFTVPPDVPKLKKRAAPEDKQEDGGGKTGKTGDKKPDSKPEPEKTASDSEAKAAEEEKRKKVATATAAESTAEALKNAGEKSGQEATSYEGLVQSYQDFRTKVLELLSQKQELEAKALASKHAFALKMTQVHDQQTIQANITDALYQAVGALKQASVILRNAAAFWKSLAQKCEELADSGLLRKVEIFQKLPIETQISQYEKMEFKVNVVTHYAKWLAIKVLARDYQAEVQRIRSGLQEDIVKNPTTQQSIECASELGKQLLEQVNQEIALNDKQKRELTAERAV